MDVWAKRVADDKDPLRLLLRAAKAWGIPPTVVIGERAVNTREYTARDIDLVLTLEVYEAGLCPGGNHVLAETSKPEHADAYRPAGEPEHIQCHHCKADALLAKQLSEKDSPAGLFIPIELDPEVVARNLLPVPELPPELRGE